MAKSLKVDIIGDASSYMRALNTASHANTGFGSSLARVSKIALLSAGTAGIGALAVGLKVGVSEWIQSAKVAAQTGAVLKSTGGIANVTAKEVNSLAESIMKKTGIDDEAIKAGENWLLTFKNVRNEVGANNDIFTQATKTTADLAVAQANAKGGAINLGAASNLLGKALNDPVKGLTALGKAGVTFTDSQKEAIKALVASGNLLGAQKIILKEVKSQVEGSAEAYGKTLPGQINILKESFRNMSSELIQKALPSFQRLVTFLSSNMPQIQAAASTAFSAIGSVIGTAVATIKRHWDTIIATGRTVITILTGIANFLRTDIGQAFGIAAVGVFGLVKAIQAFRAAALLLGATSGPLAAVGLALTGIAFLALKFTGSAHNVDLLANSFRSLAETVRGAKAALDQIEQTDLSVQSAKLAVTETMHAERAAWQALTKVRNDAKASTLQVAQAEDAYNRSVLTHKQALVDLSTAQKANVTANKELTSSFVDHVSKLQLTIGKGAEFIAQLQKWGVETGKQELVQGRINKAIADTTATLSTGAAAMTAYALKTGAVPTAANLAAIKVRDLDLATKNFITTHGRLPTKTELAIIIKKIDTRNFAAELASLKTTAQTTAKAASDVFHGTIQQVPKSAAAAAKDAVAAVRNQTGAASSAGSAVGSALGSGIGAGIGATIQGVINNATSLVQAAINAARNAAERPHSPSKATIPIGMALGEGVSFGLISTIAKVGAAATKVVDSVKTGFAKGVPRVGDALKLLGPSLVKSLTASFKPLETASLKGMTDVGKIIVATAKKYGVDAKAALAVAMGEGGIEFGRVGDSGTSFGPFQLHIGGALGNMDPAKAAAFANSIEGIDFAIRKMAESGAKGKVGFDAIDAIVRRFERPADPDASVRNAMANYSRIPEVAATAIKAGAPKVTAAQRAVLTGLEALVRQYAPTIGIEQVKGIIKGLDIRNPEFLAKSKAAMAEAQTAMRTKILEGAATVGDAFGQMADRALAKFDEKVAKWKNPLTAKLAGMQNVDAAKQGAEGLAGAMQKIFGGDVLSTQKLTETLGTQLGTALSQAMGVIGGAKTQQALTAAAGKASTQMAAAINAAAAPALAQADAQIATAQAALAAAQAAGDQEAITKAQTELDTAVTNRQTLGAAVRAEIERTTGVLATAVDTQHTKIAERDRAGLGKQLTQLGTELAKHPGKWAAMGNEVNKALAGYNIRLQTAGKTWAEKFAAGISSGKSFVTTAVRDLVAAALAQVHQSPPKEGPLAGGTVERAGKLLAKEYAGGIASASGLVSSAMTAMLGAGLPRAVPTGGGSLAMAGAPAGGGGITWTGNVVVQGSLLGSTVPEVADTIRRELLRTSARNAGAGLG